MPQQPKAEITCMRPPSPRAGPPEFPWAKVQGDLLMPQQAKAEVTCIKAEEAGGGVTTSVVSVSRRIKRKTADPTYVQATKSVPVEERPGKLRPPTSSHSHQVSHVRGTLRVGSCRPSKLNARISGVYTPRVGGFGRAKAWQLDRRHKGEEKDSCLLLFYRAQKWAFAEVKNNPRRVVCLCKVDAPEGDLTEPWELPVTSRWEIWDRERDAWTVDTSIRCTPLSQRSAGVVGEIDEEGEEEAEEEQVVEEEEEHRDVSAVAPAPAKWLRVSIGSGEAEAPWAPASSHCSWGALRERRSPPIGYCAKMLVDTGVRCPCHFLPANECPGTP